MTSQPRTSQRETAGGDTGAKNDHTGAVAEWERHPKEEMEGLDNCPLFSGRLWLYVINKPPRLLLCRWEF